MNPQKPSREVVPYDPKDYTDLNYAAIDRYNTRRIQRAEKVKLEQEIEQLQENLLMGNTEETQEMKQLIEEIKETEAQLDLNSSEYIEDNDVKIFIKLANYIRDKVGSPDNMDRMISNICKLYSAKSSFETDMKDILKGVKGETDWFEKNKIRNFHN